MRDCGERGYRVSRIAYRVLSVEYNNYGVLDRRNRGKEGEGEINEGTGHKPVVMFHFHFRIHLHPPSHHPKRV